MRGEVFSGNFEIKSKVSNPKFEAFAETYLQRRQYLRSSERDGHSVKNLLKFFRGKVLLAIQASNIEDYIAKRRTDGVSNATINRELAALKRMYTLAIKWGDANKNPVKEIEFLEEPPGRSRFLSREEAQWLIECSTEHLKPVVITALNTGMRLGEVIGLKWEQVFIDNVIDPYLELELTKNNKKRFVPLNNDLVELFKGIRSKSTGSQEVFLNHRGKAIKSIRTAFVTALQKAGILDFRFHDLRQTFASHFLMNGGDMLTLKEILGHSSLKMVERYAHLAAAHKRRQVNNLNGMFLNCHPIATSEKLAKVGGVVST